MGSAEEAKEWHRKYAVNATLEWFNNAEATLARALDEVRRNRDKFKKAIDGDYNVPPADILSWTVNEMVYVLPNLHVTDAMRRTGDLALHMDK